MTIELPVTELVLFVVHSSRAEEFPAALAQGAVYLQGAEGYRGHTLSRCIEQPDNFVLLVHWRSLADHTKDFRASPEYGQWRKMITPFLAGEPDVRHIIVGEDPPYKNLLDHPLLARGSD